MLFRSTSGQARVVWSNGAKGTARPHCAVSSSRTKIVFYADWHNTGNQTGASPVLMLETNDNLWGTGTELKGVSVKPHGYQAIVSPEYTTSGNPTHTCGVKTINPDGSYGQFHPLKVVVTR